MVAIWVVFQELLPVGQDFWDSGHEFKNSTSSPTPLSTTKEFDCAIVNGSLQDTLTAGGRPSD